MGYHIQWDNEERTVVLHHHTAPYAARDVHRLSEESEKMLQSVPHTVHIIIDQRLVKVTLTPADIYFLEAHVPPNQGMVVSVVTKSDLDFEKMMSSLVKKQAPKAFGKAALAETVEEARQRLVEDFGVRYP